MKPRRRHKGGKLAEKFKRFEDDVGGSVAPAVLQAIEQPTVRQKRQALRGDRRAAGITKQPLEPEISKTIERYLKESKS